MNIEQTEGRLIAIGDIHGCLDKLKIILEAIDPQKDDTFVFLGDLVNRGPDSKGVIDEVMSLSEKSTVHCVMGNHEEMILAAFTGGPSEHKFWCKFGGIETLASYGVSFAKDIPRDHLKFIAYCHEYLESDDYIFVHAGCKFDQPLSENTSDVLRWDKLSESEPHISGKTVVCGHTVHKQILDLGHLICIDTGCGVWAGGRLSAIDLKYGKIWQCRKNLTIMQR